MNPLITAFDGQLHRDQVISLWKEVSGYETDHNASLLVIDKKLEFIAVDWIVRHMAIIVGLLSSLE